MSVSGTKLLLRAREASLPCEGMARGWNDIDWDKVNYRGDVEVWDDGKD